jgi:class 3 adenylate cyclase
VIAVQLNTGIDYFGSTVNFAAKIQSCADAYEIAMSSAVYQAFQKDFASRFGVEMRKYGAEGIEVSVAQVKPFVRADAA